MEYAIAIGAVGVVGAVLYAVSVYEPPVQEQVDNTQPMHIDTGLQHETLRTTTGADAAIDGINKGYNPPPFMLRPGSSSGMFLEHTMKEMQKADYKIADQAQAKTASQMSSIPQQIPASDPTQKHTVQTLGEVPVVKLAQNMKPVEQLASKINKFTMKLHPPPFLPTRKINIF